MRKLWLTLALVGLLALPVLAQRFGGGMFGGGFSGDALLMNKGVQKELKLDDKQMKALAEISKAADEHRAKAREAFQDGDAEKGKEHMQKANEEQAKGLKKFKDTLNSEQQKRFQEIEVNVARQFTNPDIFKHAGVVKALKLTSKQQESLKEAMSDLEKDSKEVMEDAKGDFGKLKGAFKKLQTLRKDTYEKITKGLTDEQQKTLKDIGGEKFELKFDKGKFGKGGKNKKKKDDF
jgi:hypothetical protein